MIEYLKWREIEKPENIDSNDDGVKTEYNKGYSILYKTDKLERPVLYVQCSKYDKNNRILENVKKFVIWEMEIAVFQLSKPEDEKIVVLFDLLEFSLVKTMDYEVVKMFINILQNNYDEILGLGIIVNSPWIFSACWKIIKPWLDPATAAKIRFMNIEEVTEVIEPECMPDFLLKQRKIKDDALMQSE